MRHVGQAHATRPLGHTLERNCFYRTIYDVVALVDRVCTENDCRLKLSYARDTYAGVRRCFMQFLSCSHDFVACLLRNQRRNLETDAPAVSSVELTAGGGPIGILVRTCTQTLLRLAFLWVHLADKFFRSDGRGI